MRARLFIPTLLTELQRTFIRAKTPIGEAISPPTSSWRLEKDGSFVAQFSPLAAERLPDASGLELLRAAQSLGCRPEPGGLSGTAGGTPRCRQAATARPGERQW